MAGFNIGSRIEYLDGDVAVFVRIGQDGNVKYAYFEDMGADGPEIDVDDAVPGGSQGLRDPRGGRAGDQGLSVQPAAKHRDQERQGCPVCLSWADGDGQADDQLGRHLDAQGYYASALKIKPDDPSVLSNLGLSYALAKDLKRAEETLRRAATLPGAEPREIVVAERGVFPSQTIWPSPHLPG